MSNNDTTSLTPVPEGITGRHDLVGWGSYDMLHESILPRVFGYLVQMAAPVVKEYHGDLYHDADSLRVWLNNALLGDTGRTSASFQFCVRHSGTNFGPHAHLMFESVAYDAVLYSLDVAKDERDRWWLTSDVLGSRPVRPVN